MVCALHLPDAVSPGEIMADAETAARERLAVAHWDEFQALIAEEVASRVEQAYTFVSEHLRQLASGEGRS